MQLHIRVYRRESGELSGAVVESAVCGKARIGGPGRTRLSLGTLGAVSYTHL